MLTLDPQILIAIQPLLEAAAAAPPLEPGDWRSRRERINLSYSALANAVPIPGDVVVTEHEALASDGAPIPLRLYRKKDTQPPAVVVYVHGGGKFACSLDTHDTICRRYASASGVAVLAVGFRLAPEFQSPIPIEDCYAGLTWTVAHTADFGFDRARVGIAGDSGGGGIAAGVALMARDRGGPALAMQMLIYPMLDDRNTKPDPFLVSVDKTWTYEDNFMGWQTLLGDAVGSNAVPSYAAPAREQHMANLAPAYIEVGELDIFRNEAISYAARLAQSGVSIELHVHVGAPHGFDIFAPDADVSKRAMADRIRMMRTLLTKRS